MAFAPMILIAAGTGLTAYSQYKQGQTQQKISEYNAAVKKNEALRLEMESQEATRRQRQQNKKLLAQQRARIGKAGVVEAGSPLELMAEDAGLLELQALDARRSAFVKQQQLQQSAKLDVWSGKQAALAGKISAGASLLEGAGNIAAMPKQPKD